MANSIVLAAVDLQHSESDKNVAEEALGLARNHGADLHLVFVIPDEQNDFVQAYIPADMKAKVGKDAKKELDAFSGSLDSAGTTMETHIMRGVVYQKIIELAGRIGANYVVLGAHRPGFMDFFQGPNSARVARHADCSVLIVRPTRSG